MWDLPGPGLEPVSPALAGRFLTTAPPGKSPHLFLNTDSKLYKLKRFGTFHFSLKNTFEGHAIINY